MAFIFSLEGFGQVEALGWVLWRRTGDCEVPVGEAAEPLSLRAGLGVLFEAIPLDARLHIAKLIQEGGTEKRAS